MPNSSKKERKKFEADETHFPTRNAARLRDCLDRVSSRHPLGQRLKALRDTGLTSLVAGVTVDDPIAVWSAVCDMAAPQAPQEARRAAYAVASAILGFDGSQDASDAGGVVRAAQSGDPPTHVTHLLVAEVLGTVIGPGVDASADPLARLTVVAHATRGGRKIYSFAPRVTSALVEWLELRDGEEGGSPVLREACLVMAASLVRFAFTLLTADEARQIVMAACLAAGAAIPQGHAAVVEAALEFLDVLVRYGLVPIDTVTQVACTLSRAVAVERYAGASWAIMRNMLKSYRGHQTMLALCKILDDSAGTDDSGMAARRSQSMVTFLRAVVFFIAMACWGSQRVTSIHYSFSAILGSFHRVLRLNDAVIAYEVLLSVRRLIRKFSHRLHAEWDIVFSILGACVPHVQQDETSELARVLLVTISDIEAIARATDDNEAHPDIDAAIGTMAGPGADQQAQQRRSSPPKSSSPAGNRRSTADATDRVLYNTQGIVREDALTQACTPPRDSESNAGESSIAVAASGAPARRVFLGDPESLHDLCERLRPLRTVQEVLRTLRYRSALATPFASEDWSGSLQRLLSVYLVGERRATIRLAALDHLKSIVGHARQLGELCHVNATDHSTTNTATNTTTTTAAATTQPASSSSQHHGASQHDASSAAANPGGAHIAYGPGTNVRGHFSDAPWNGPQPEMELDRIVLDAVSRLNDEEDEDVRRRSAEVLVAYAVQSGEGSFGRYHDTMMRCLEEATDTEVQISIVRGLVAMMKRLFIVPRHLALSNGSVLRLCSSILGVLQSPNPTVRHTVLGFFAGLGATETGEMTFAGTPSSTLWCSASSGGGVHGGSDSDNRRSPLGAVLPIPDIVDALITHCVTEPSAPLFLLTCDALGALIRNVHVLRDVCVDACVRRISRLVARGEFGARCWSGADIKRPDASSIGGPGTGGGNGGGHSGQGSHHQHGHPGHHGHHHHGHHSHHHNHNHHSRRSQSVSVSASRAQANSGDAHGGSALGLASPSSTATSTGGGRKRTLSVGGPAKESPGAPAGVGGGPQNATAHSVTHSSPGVRSPGAAQRQLAVASTTAQSPALTKPHVTDPSGANVDNGPPANSPSQRSSSSPLSMQRSASGRVIDSACDNNNSNNNDHGHGHGTHGRHHSTSDITGYGTTSAGRTNSAGDAHDDGVGVTWLPPIETLTSQQFELRQQAVARGLDVLFDLVAYGDRIADHTRRALVECVAGVLKPSPYSAPSLISRCSRIVSAVVAAPVRTQGHNDSSNSNDTIGRMSTSVSLASVLGKFAELAREGLVYMAMLECLDVAIGCPGAGYVDAFDIQGFDALFGFLLEVAAPTKDTRRNPPTHPRVIQEPSDPRHTSLFALDLVCRYFARAPAPIRRQCVTPIRARLAQIAAAEREAEAKAGNTKTRDGVRRSDSAHVVGHGADHEGGKTGLGAHSASMVSLSAHENDGNSGGGDANANDGSANSQQPSLADAAAVCADFVTRSVAHPLSPVVPNPLRSVQAPPGMCANWAVLPVDPCGAPALVTIVVDPAMGQATQTVRGPNGSLVMRSWTVNGHAAAELNVAELLASAPSAPAPLLHASMLAELGSGEGNYRHHHGSHRQHYARHHYHGRGFRAMREGGRGFAHASSGQGTSEGSATDTTDMMTTDMTSENDPTFTGTAALSSSGYRGEPTHPATGKQSVTSSPQRAVKQTTVDSLANPLPARPVHTSVSGTDIFGDARLRVSRQSHLSSDHEGLGAVDHVNNDGRIDEDDTGEGEATTTDTAADYFGEGGITNNANANPNPNIDTDMRSPARRVADGSDVEKVGDGDSSLSGDGAEEQFCATSSVSGTRQSDDEDANRRSGRGGVHDSSIDCGSDEAAVVPTQRPRTYRARRGSSGKGRGKGKGKGKGKEKTRAEKGVFATGGNGVGKTEKTSRAGGHHHHHGHGHSQHHRPHASTDADGESSVPSSAVDPVVLKPDLSASAILGGSMPPPIGLLPSMNKLSEMQREAFGLALASVSPHTIDAISVMHPILALAGNSGGGSTAGIGGGAATAAGATGSGSQSTPGAGGGIGSNAPSSVSSPGSVFLRNGESLDRAVAVLDLALPDETHKIAVLYVGPGQTGDETAILANTSGSSGYVRLLSSLGTLVRLQECARLGVYTGGLDRSPDEADGPFALVTSDPTSSTVFHVATLMPTRTARDPHCMLKKRHIGNDHVTIVYSDDDTADFDGGTISGQYNFVHIVVAAVRGTRMYRVRVKVKDGLRIAFGPLRGECLVSEDALGALVSRTAIIADTATRVFLRNQREGRAFVSNREARIDQIRTIAMRFSS